MNCFRNKSMKMTGLLIISYLMFSCGGSLSEEQRKEMRDKMEMEVGDKRGKTRFGERNPRAYSISTNHFN